MDLNSSVRTRSTTYGPVWSVRISPSGARVIASAEQLAILKKLYARTGEDATKEDIDEVARETGLDCKWIRKWVKRQRGGEKGKGRKSGETHNPSESTVPTLPSRGPSTGDVLAAPSPQETNSAAPGATTSGDGLTLTVLRPAPSTQQISRFSRTIGSRSGSAAPADSTSPVTAYTGASDWNEDGLRRGIQLPPSSMTAFAQAANPGASFTFPLPPDTTSQYIGVPSPIFQTNAIHGDTLPFTAIQSVRQAELITTYTGSASYRYPEAGMSPGAVPLTFSPATGSIPVFASSPDGLTASAAYLYRIFHEPSNVNAAPPEIPSFNSTSYLANLTRPSDVAQDHPTLAMSPTSGTVAPNCSYPVACQMRLSDLVSVTKAVRGTTGDCTRSSAATADAAFEDAVRRLEGVDVDGILGSYQLLWTPAAETAVEPGGTCNDNERETARETYADVDQEEDATEDEDEAVTPCDEVDLVLPTETGKNNGADVDVVVIVNEAEDRRSGPF